MSVQKDLEDFTTRIQAIFFRTMWAISEKGGDIEGLEVLDGLPNAVSTIPPGYITVASKDDLPETAPEGTIAIVG